MEIIEFRIIADRNKARQEKYIEENKIDIADFQNLDHTILKNNLIENSFHQHLNSLEEQYANTSAINHEHEYATM